RKGAKTQRKYAIILSYGELSAAPSFLISRVQWSRISSVNLCQSPAMSISAARMRSRSRSSFAETGSAFPASLSSAKRNAWIELISTIPDRMENRQHIGTSFIPRDRQMRLVDHGHQPAID